MKKVFLLLLAATLCFTALVSCGNQDGTSSADTPSADNSSQEDSMPTDTSPAYWGFNNYQTITHPNAPQEITSYKTTVTKADLITYTMSCQIEGVGEMSVSLMRKTWGTYNLVNWRLKDLNGKIHAFVDASTDMEYVHQYYYNGSSLTWSGGNHGGEALESIAFYDGETGQELDLSAVGSTATVNVLHIIEKTRLLNFPDANGDSINDYTNKNTEYTEDDIYAKLTRKYTVTGPQVKLNVDYLYTRDSYHDRNYGCMFPIKKTYGFYCDMYNAEGNLINTISTRPYGDTSIADYAGSHNSGNNAVRAVIRSDEYPQYRFDVRVNTLDSVNNFQNATYKTAFWDMNKSANKLYFSRFDQGQKILHEKGKEVHTECVWIFDYIENA